MGDGTVTLVVYGRTFDIKDELKEMGYQWHAKDGQWVKTGCTSWDETLIKGCIDNNWSGVEVEVRHE